MKKNQLSKMSKKLNGECFGSVKQCMKTASQKKAQNEP